MVINAVRFMESGCYLKCGHNFKYTIRLLFTKLNASIKHLHTDSLTTNIFRLLLDNKDDILWWQVWLQSTYQSITFIMAVITIYKQCDLTKIALNRNVYSNEFVVWSQCAGVTLLINVVFQQQLAPAYNYAPSYKSNKQNSVKKVIGGFQLC